MDGSQTLQKLGKIEHSHPLRETVFSNDLIEQFTIRNQFGHYVQYSVLLKGPLEFQYVG